MKRDSFFFYVKLVKKEKKKYFFELPLLKRSLVFLEVESKNLKKLKTGRLYFLKFKKIEEAFSLDYFSEKEKKLFLEIYSFFKKCRTQTLREYSLIKSFFFHYGSFLQFKDDLQEIFERDSFFKTYTMQEQDLLKKIFKKCSLKKQENLFVVNLFLTLSVFEKAFFEKLLLEFVALSKSFSFSFSFFFLSAGRFRLKLTSGSPMQIKKILRAIELYLASYSQVLDFKFVPI